MGIWLTPSSQSVSRGGRRGEVVRNDKYQELLAACRPGTGHFGARTNPGAASNEQAESAEAKMMAGVERPRPP